MEQIYHVASLIFLDSQICKFTFLFHFGIIIHQLFKKRIDCIKNKKVLQDHFDFLFLLHGLEDLNIVLEKTIFMNYSNFYFYLTIIFFMFT